MDEISFLTHSSPYLGLFLLLLLGTLGFPFPEDGILLLSGYLIAQGVINPVYAVLVLYPGLLLTDFSLYWMGKTCARRFLGHRKCQRFVPRERVLRLEERFGRWGGWVIFFGRHPLKGTH